MGSYETKNKRIFKSFSDLICLKQNTCGVF